MDDFHSSTNLFPIPLICNPLQICFPASSLFSKFLYHLLEQQHLMSDKISYLRWLNQICYFGFSDPFEFQSSIEFCFYSLFCWLVHILLIWKVIFKFLYNFQWLTGPIQSVCIHLWNYYLGIVTFIISPHPILVFVFIELFWMSLIAILFFLFINMPILSAVFFCCFSEYRDSCFSLYFCYHVFKFSDLPFVLFILLLQIWLS